jgi:hypothetical protein
MVRTVISVEAFEAIARTLPVGSVGYENEANERGEKLISLDRAVIDRLRSLRGSYMLAGHDERNARWSLLGR